MPLFGNAFSPKKTPPRKSASLSNLHTLDYVSRAVELGLEHGPPSVTIGDHKLIFHDDGEWASESVGSGGGRELKRLTQRNDSLTEENNLLKLKLTLLLDMLSECTAENQQLERDLTQLKSRSISRRK